MGHTGRHPITGTIQGSANKGSDLRLVVETNSEALSNSKQFVNIQIWGQIIRPQDEFQNKLETNTQIVGE